MALFLASTSSKLQVITGAASAIDVHASWLDNLSGAITPGTTNTPPITTAATTDVVASPAASTQRNIKGLYITNTHASLATQVTVVHTDGTNAKQIMGVTLLAGENLNFDAEGEWHHRDAQGAEYFPAFPPFDSYGLGYGITGTVAETVARHLVDSTQAGTTSGLMYLTAVYLRAGQKINNLSFFATVAASGMTHGLFGIYNSSLALVATSADFLTEGWLVNTIKTKPLTATYTVPTTGLYYFAVMTANSTTQPSYAAKGTGNTTLKGLAPALSGSSTTGLTTALPATAAAITNQATHIWGAAT